MTRVVVEDERLIAALSATPQRAELCDPSGRVLGYYVPTSAGNVFYRGVKSPLSPEERERLLKEEGPTARPLSEFFDKLQNKYPDAHEQAFWDELRKDPDQSR